MLQLFFIICGNLTWETNDDELFNLIAAGAYGFSNSQYLIFINIIYGWMVKMLYYLFPSLNAYLFFMLGLNSFFIICLCLELTENLSVFHSIFVTILINLFLRLNYFSILQFTKNAFLYTIVGCLLILNGIKKKSILKTCLGYLGIILGFCVRWESCIFIVPFFLLFLGFHLARSKSRKSYILPLIILPFFILFVWFIDNKAYSSEPWKYYNSYNKVRSSLLDYGIPSYTEHRSEYESLSVSENDVVMLENWLFSDETVFSLEKLQEINQLKDSSGSFSIISFNRKGLSSLQDCLTIHPIFPITWVLILFFLTLFGKKDEQILGILCSSLIFMLYCYLASSRIQWRVEIGIWLASILLFLPILIQHIESNQNNLRSYNSYLLFILVLITSIPMFSLSYYFVKEKHCSIRSLHECELDLVQKLNLDNSNYYLGDSLTLSTVPFTPALVDVTRSKYEGFFQKNFQIIAGWEYPSPLVKQALGLHGINNPLEDLLNDNVYYVTRDQTDRHPEQNILKFLQEHHDPSTMLIDKGYIDYIHVYEFKSSE